MSDEQVIQEAKRVVHDAYERGPKYHTDHLVDALHAAGLLASPEMRELCEAVNAHIAPASIDDVTRDCDFLDTWKRVRRAVRAYRAAKQPKPRWVGTGDGWVVDTGTGNRWLGGSFFTEAQARAVAAALNALAAESPR